MRFGKVCLLFFLAVLAAVLSACSPEPTPTPVPEAPAYAEILTSYRSNLTDLQRKEYNANMVLGHRAAWDGYIIDITEKSDNYEYRVIRLAMSDNPKELGGIVHLIMPVEDTKGLAKDMRLYFSGKATKTAEDGSLIVNYAELLPNPSTGTHAPASFAEVVESLRTLENRDWMAYRQTVLDSTAAWDGWVLNVTEKGVVVLSAKANGQYDDIYLSGLPMEEALLLKTGQKYNVQGKVTNLKVDVRTINYEDKKFVRAYITSTLEPAGTGTPDGE